MKEQEVEKKKKYLSGQVWRLIHDIKVALIWMGFDEVFNNRWLVLTLVENIDRRMTAPVVLPWAIKAPKYLLRDADLQDLLEGATLLDERLNCEPAVGNPKIDL